MCPRRVRPTVITGDLANGDEFFKLASFLIVVRHNTDCQVANDSVRMWGIAREWGCQGIRVEI
jgi:hypothetical protein